MLDSEEPLLAGNRLHPGSPPGFFRVGLRLTEQDGLVALPGQVHSVGRVADVETGGDLGSLALVKCSTPWWSSPRIFVQRVVFVPRRCSVSCWTPRRTSSTTWFRA